MLRSSVSAALLTGALALTGCATMDAPSTPVPRASQVSIDRYSGTWFVIASIPLPIEVDSYNPVESYARNPDGTIATVFQFRKGAYDGKLEVKPIVSEVKPGTDNAEWEVQTIWPLKQQYVISYLEPDYSSVIVGRDARDHVWILSRTPKLPAGRMEEYRKRMADEGYDVSKLLVFPQNGDRPIPG